MRYPLKKCQNRQAQTSELDEPTLTSGKNHQTPAIFYTVLLQNVQILSSIKSQFCQQNFGRF